MYVCTYASIYIYGIACTVLLRVLFGLIPILAGALSALQPLLALYISISISVDGSIYIYI